MSLERRLMLLLGLVFGLGLGLFQIASYQYAKHNAEADLLESAERVRNVLMATRRVYHHQFVDSGVPITEKTIGFLPAHAMNRISRDLANWDKSGFSFNNVSDNPRNPAQRADAVEMEAIALFRQQPELERRFVAFSNERGEPYFHYARPIWVEEYCLGCHGAKKDAPEAIQRLYPNAYDYKVGDLRGILSIKVPARQLQERIWQVFFGQLLWSGLLFGLCGLIVAWAVGKYLTRPLATLTRSINDLAAGNLAGRVPALVGEFDVVGQAFNHMGAALQLEQERLQDSEERFRSLVDTAPDAILLTDGEGLILFWNKGAEGIFGWRAEEMVGQLMDGLIPERYRKAYVQAVRHVATRGESRMLGAIDEFWAVTRDHREIAVEISLNSWLAGHSRLYVTVIRDISARKAAEEANRAKSSFLANMSHEIRTPMNAIIGMAHLVRRNVTESHQQEQLQKITDAAEHLLSLINDILDISKIEAGKLSLEMADFDVDALFESVANLVGPRAEAKGLELVHDLDPRLPIVLNGDVTRLRQVLVNFMTNAVKFSGQGVVILRARIQETFATSLSLRFEVEDRGVGISPDDLARIFEPFEQADSSTTRLYGGTGLGLAINRRLIALMGGEIGVESEPGKGSKFWFSIPLNLPSGTSHADSVPTDWHWRHGLVVDDASEAREVLAGLLLSMGMGVETASSGEEGLRRLKVADQAGDPFDLVLADWRMPGMDGLAFGRAIQDIGLARPPLHLLVTAYDHLLDIEAAQAAGFALVLSKPVTPFSLLRAVRGLAGASHEPGSAFSSGVAERELARRCQGKTILLVEDNPINQEVAVELLEAAGLHVQVADDGAQAVEKVAQSAFDLILMDIQMPVMDGLAATRRIRTLPYGQHVPILAMTADAFEVHRQRCLEAGMNDHVPKPVNPEVLYSRLLHWLEGPRGALPSATDSSVERVEPASLLVSLRSIPGIDPDFGLGSVRGNLDHYCQLLGKFLAHTASAPDQLDALCKAGDKDGLLAQAHGLKGVSATLGLVAVNEAARRVEEAVRAGGLSDELGQSVEALKQALLRIMSALNDALD